ncbi:uncharacterized protein LOC126388232 isoform X1 [Epinephelus moara]|uniref:uncharacterized protein LOC126388232 isoform X1 n=1 Tax=Epinephelus moara TaxID=300413 RepID=UPI00214ED762|nr:uncharacterized protein LOC126388232 isoform X1 [Epinephelus moara]
MRACSSNHPIRACRLAASKAPAGKQMHSCQGADTAATAHGNCNSKWSRGGRGDGQKSRVTPSGGGPVAPGATAAACRASACHSPVEKVVEIDGWRAGGCGCLHTFTCLTKEHLSDQPSEPSSASFLHCNHTCHHSVQVHLRRPSKRLRFVSTQCEEVGSEINLVSSVNLHQAAAWHNRTGLLEVAPILFVSASHCQESITGDPVYAL